MTSSKDTNKEALKLTRKLLQYHKDESNKYVLSMYHLEMANRLARDIERLERIVTEKRKR
jgi:hypothetical protein